MAVEQTRDFFLARDGRLTDNPRVGPTLREAYWKPGNSRRFADLVAGLTGAPLSARHLAGRVNRTADEAAQRAREELGRAGPGGARPAAPVELRASIRVMHGNERIASTEGRSFEDCAAAFADFVTRQERAAAPRA
jgi:hypothetical protein